MNFRTFILSAVMSIGLTHAAMSQSLLTNSDFSDGTTGWTAGCNKYDASAWYAYVALTTEQQTAAISTTSGAVTIKTVGDATAVYTETLLIQTISPTRIISGDVIHFTGDYVVDVTSNGSGGIKARFFIRGLDTWYAVKTWSVTSEVSVDAVAGGQKIGSFDFTATVSDVSYLDQVQIGVALYNNDSMDDAALSVSNLDAWINDGKWTVGETGKWAGIAKEANGYVNTGNWLGYIYPVGDWVWSDSLQKWLYLPEANVRSNGAWYYVMGE